MPFKNNNYKHEYSKQLLDPRWIETRDRILERDNYECQYCYDRENLNVHHYKYEKDKYPWEYDDKNLVTLCRCCHLTEHELIKIKNYEKIYRY